jgi:hypothetical protein
MSYRVEQTDPLTLLCELPSQWAQTCVTSPRRDEPVSYLLAVLDEVRRVLREDGTLWLLCSEKNLPAALAERGWMPRRVDWATPLRVDPGGRARLYLLVKQPCYYYNSQAAQLFLAPRTQTALACTTGRRRGCAWSPGRRRELMRLCVVAGSSRAACGACGAPYTRTSRGRRATCAHHNPGGRCLVLDPFYHPAIGTHKIADRYGRAFLGITAGERK